MYAVLLYSRFPHDEFCHWQVGNNLQQWITMDCGWVYHSQLRFHGDFKRFQKNTSQGNMPTASISITWGVKTPHPLSVTSGGVQVPKAELTKTPRDEEDDEPLFPMELSRSSTQPSTTGATNTTGIRLARKFVQLDVACPKFNNATLKIGHPKSGN